MSKDQLRAVSDALHNGAEPGEVWGKIDVQPAKLWLYSNLIGIFGWAESKADFLKRYPLARDGAVIVRCAHQGVKPKDGYRKGKDELAYTPIELCP